MRGLALWLAIAAVIGCKPKVKTEDRRSEPVPDAGVFLAASEPVPNGVPASTAPETLPNVESVGGKVDCVATDASGTAPLPRTAVVQFANGGLAQQALPAGCIGISVKPPQGTAVLGAQVLQGSGRDGLQLMGTLQVVGQVGSIGTMSPTATAPSSAPMPTATATAPAPAPASAPTSSPYLAPNVSSPFVGGGQNIGTATDKCRGFIEGSDGECYDCGGFQWFYGCQNALNFVTTFVDNCLDSLGGLQSALEKIPGYKNLPKEVRDQIQAQLEAQMKGLKDAVGPKIDPPPGFFSVAPDRLGLPKDVVDAIPGLKGILDQVQTIGNRLTQCLVNLPASLATAALECGVEHGSAVCINVKQFGIGGAGLQFGSKCYTASGREGTYQQTSIGVACIPNGATRSDCQRPMKDCVSDPLPGFETVEALAAWCANKPPNPPPVVNLYKQASCKDTQGTVTWRVCVPASCATIGQ